VVDLRSHNNRLLLKDLSVVLKEADVNFVGPFEKPLFPPSGKIRPHTDLVEAAGFKRDHDDLFGLNFHDLVVSKLFKLKTAPFSKDLRVFNKLNLNRYLKVIRDLHRRPYHQLLHSICLLGLTDDIQLPLFIKVNPLACQAVEIHFESLGVLLDLKVHFLRLPS
jgi:hypothetical protein